MKTIKVFYIKKKLKIKLEVLTTAALGTYSPSRP